MNQLLTVVIPLSLGAAVSPTVLAVVVLTLTSRVAPRGRAWAITLGMAAGLLAFTALLGVLAKFAADAKADPRLLGGIDVVAGLALLGLGIRDAVNLRKPSVKRRSKEAQARTRPELLAFLGIGFALMLTDVTSIVLYLPAVKAIVESSIAAAQKVMVALIPFFAVLAPALLPAALATAAPKTADRVLTPLNSWVTKNERVIGMVVCFVFGVYLLVKGGLGVMK